MPMPTYWFVQQDHAVAGELHEAVLWQASASIDTVGNAVGSARPTALHEHQTAGRANQGKGYVLLYASSTRC